MYLHDDWKVDQVLVLDSVGAHPLVAVAHPPILDATGMHHAISIEPDPGHTMFNNPVELACKAFVADQCKMGSSLSWQLVHTLAD